MLRTLFILFALGCARFTAAQVIFQSSNLPIVLINTNGQAIVDEPKITADLRIVYNGAGQRNLVAGPFLGYDGKVGVELRGSTSQALYDKKGMSLELRDDLGADRSESLLGMPKESDWVLIGPYNDKSLMRDALAYYTIGQIMRYAPRMHLVEVVVNGNYRGVYLLGEKVKRDKDRVNVAKNDTDVTGGYIIKMDKFTGANNDSWQSQYPPTAGTSQRTDFLYHYPAADQITTQQRDYIQNWFRGFENALAGSSFKDTLTGYRKWIDTPTFIDYMLVNEAFRNVDAYRLSTYCYKDRDSINPRLQMGPVWDFNIAFGLGDYCDGQRTDGWAWNHHIPCEQDQWLVPFWWERLRQDPRYVQESVDRWKQLRNTTMSTAALNHTIDSLSTLLQEAQVRNFQRWPVMGIYVWPNAFVGINYNSEVQYLRGWLSNRLTWMDGALMQLVDVTNYDPKHKWEAQVFPNPAQGGQYYTKVYAKKGDRISVRMYAADGALVQSYADLMSESGEQSMVWPPIKVHGTYFWEVQVNGERKGSGKLVVVD